MANNTDNAGKQTARDWWRDLNSLDKDNMNKKYYPLFPHHSLTDWNISDMYEWELQEENKTLQSHVKVLRDALRELLDCDYTSGTHLYTSQIKAKEALNQTK